MAKADTLKRSHEFKPGWAEKGGLEQAAIDRAEGLESYVRTPEQRERMALAQRARWRKVQEKRAAKAKKATAKRPARGQR